MSSNDSARTINATAYSYISSWALLTAAELRVFDRLPAKSTDLAEAFPDADLVDTWMLTLADAGLVFNNDGTWTQTDEGASNSPASSCEEYVFRKQRSW